jgi:hypothetical protein
LKIHKIEIAKRQIDVAIDLLRTDGDYLAIITLAGAAEEILGVLLKRQNKLAMVDHLKELDGKLSGGRPYKVFNDEINGIRNALKHAKFPDEDEIEVEHCDAVAMLSRAVANYILLGGAESPKIIWFYEYLNTYCE